MSELVKSPALEKMNYGVNANGEPVSLYRLRNRQGMEMAVLDYGATVTELHVPDKHGQTTDVVLGFDNLKDYETRSPYFGCVVGRCGNRIAGGNFALDGKEYILYKNDAVHHLHGGKRGFDKVMWKTDPIETPHGPALHFQYLSPDGEENYPGALHVNLIYTLTQDNAFRIEYTAVTDKPTIVNLTQHSYFNLAGDGDVLGHEIRVFADKTTAVDAKLIPNGQLAPVEGTLLDLRQPVRIGDRAHLVGTEPKGFDHNYVLKTQCDERMVHAATVLHPDSGRGMEVHTDQPGVQFYSGNFLDGTLRGKNGAIYQKHAGLCLETQMFPDSVHHPEFPSVILRPGNTYRHVCVYRFIN